MKRTEDFYSIEELSERLSPEGLKVLDMVKGLGKADQTAIFGILTKLLLEPLVSGDDEEYWDDDEDEWDDGDLPTDGPDYPCFKPAANVQKYTIRIQLKNIKPAIYRKVEVPSNITLRFLGEFLLDIMGWERAHLWHFRSKEIFYDPECEAEEKSLFSNNRKLPAQDYTIADVLIDKGKSIELEYDFGDSWLHDVKLSSVAEYKEGEERVFRFVKGERNCPPEDIGGIWGYQDLCEILSTAKNKKQALKNTLFVGLEGYDPQFFSAKDCEEICEVYNTLC